MDKDVIRRRVEVAMNADFVTLAEKMAGHEVPADARAAHALEYIAYQLGKIRQAVEKKVD